MQMIKNIPELEKRIEYFVDSNQRKAGEIYFGKATYGPDMLKRSEQCYPILICAMRAYRDIEETIKKMGIKNPYFIA